VVAAFITGRFTARFLSDMKLGSSFMTAALGFGQPCRVKADLCFGDAVERGLNQ
jgi:hypothetical protein